MWRRRRWADLLWHIDHLPRNSLFFEAMGTDEELARMIAEEEMRAGESDGGAHRPAISEYDLHADLLTTAVNELRSLKATVIGALSSSNPQVDFLRGPEYAIEKMRHEARKRAHYDLAARMVPHQYPDGPPPA